MLIIRLNLNLFSFFRLTAKDLAGLLEYSLNGYFNHTNHRPAIVSFLLKGL